MMINPVDGDKKKADDKADEFRQQVIEFIKNIPGCINFGQVRNIQFQYEKSNNNREHAITEGFDP